MVLGIALLCNDFILDGFVVVLRRNDFRLLPRFILNTIPQKLLLTIIMLYKRRLLRLCLVVFEMPEWTFFTIIPLPVKLPCRTVITTAVTIAKATVWTMFAVSIAVTAERLPFAIIKATEGLAIAITIAKPAERLAIAIAAIIS
ncbi:MAG: hypothetical protein IKP58_10925, partial [Victivallales bacterium]|nr:hypothetical protein [Victivallales bacterium]